MPVQSIKSIQARVAGLKKNLTDSGLEGPKLRGLKKKLRRSQRKRRLLVAADDKRNAIVKKIQEAREAKAAAAKPAAEAPTEEATAE